MEGAMRVIEDKNKIKSALADEKVREIASPIQPQYKGFDDFFMMSELLSAMQTNNIIALLKLTNDELKSICELKGIDTKTLTTKEALKNAILK
jgi:hypothetical protein